MLSLLRLISIRHLLHSRLRSLLTVVGVAVGVATLVGVSAINRSVLSAFRSTIDTISGKADLTISGSIAGFDEALLEDFKEGKTPGILHAAGSIASVAPVKGVPGVTLYVMGVDLLDDGFFRTYEGVDKDVASFSDDLEFLNSTDRMLVSERFARDRSLKVGDSFQLLTSEGTKDFFVHGLLKESGPIKAFGGSVGVMFLGSAQEAFGKQGRLDKIDLAVAPTADADAIRETLKAKLGAGFDVERPTRRGQSVERMVRSFQLGLNLGSAVALLVGVFLVYNTVAIGVVQRRREIGTLRALGSTKRRVRALFALEAMVFGALGTLVGLPVGLFLAKFAITHVAATISAIYVQVNANAVHLETLEFVMAPIMGIGGSLFAAMQPAWLASRVHPIEALRRDVASGGAHITPTSWPILLGAGLMVLSVPATWIPPPSESLPLGGYLSMFFTLMGATMLSPLILQWLQLAYRYPGQWLFGVAGRLAADNFGRAPVRTAVPVSALAIGVAMTVCLSGFVGSFQASAERWITQAVPADLFITSSSKVAGVQNVPMKPGLEVDIEKLEGVEYVDLVRIFSHDFLGLRGYIISLSPEIYHTRAEPIIQEGKPPSPEQRRAGFVTISENLARRRDLHAGSTFKMNTPTGERSYTVACIITDYTSDQGTIFFDRTIFAEQFNDDRVDTFQVYLKDMSKLESVRKAITARWADNYGLYVLSNKELRQDALELISSTFSVTYAMELVAIILALLGVINTLLAAVLDRTREIGLLRAMGASQHHILRLFTGEAFFIGLTGGLIGSLCGWLLGLTLTKVVGVQATGWNFPFLFPWLMALQMIGAATLCAAIAGLFPARRAAKLDVVDALAYE